MMVYSILITAIMGVGNFMERDRNQGLITLLKIANRNLNHYYMVDCKINPNAVRTKKISFL
ncbi:hypothetical protein [Pediococcus pentosaceus]|uniref:hypothetical protein n=1 Tax=Pediococcus pentosaceus TaxID=1255 RepID=UPI00223AEE16|nr:hypothetical protein [Pediococcus pentosaceus]